MLDIKQLMDERNKRAAELAETARSKERFYATADVEKYTAEQWEEVQIIRAFKVFYTKDESEADRMTTDDARFVDAVKGAMRAAREDECKRFTRPLVRAMRIMFGEKADDLANEIANEFQLFEER